MRKICPECRSDFIRKDGKESGRQRYRCSTCKHVFRSPRRERSNPSEGFFERYTIRKQTVAELSEDSGLSVRTIHRRLDKAFSAKKGAEFS